MLRQVGCSKNLLKALVTLMIVGGLTACSNDDKNGTAISNRAATPAAGETESNIQPVPADQLRGADSKKASDGDNLVERVVPESTASNERGSDSKAQPVEATPIPVEETDESATPASRLGVAPDADYTNGELNTTEASELGIGGSGEYIDFQELGPNLGPDLKLCGDLKGLKKGEADSSQIYVPANNRSYAPIVTNMTDPRSEFDFTDINDDLLLNTARRLTTYNGGKGYSDLKNNDAFLPEKFFTDSQSFASDIKDIAMDIKPYTDANGVAHSPVFIDVTYDYNGADRVLRLRGVVDQDTRQAVLKQTLAQGEVAEHLFQGYLTCMDEPGVSFGCQNSLLVIEEVKAGKICKRVISAVRKTHVGIQIARKDYRTYNSETNPSKRSFIQYLANTIVNHRYMEGYIVPSDGDDFLLFGSNKRDNNNCSIPVVPTPFIQRITTSSFAVASGPAQHELVIRESDYSRLYEDQVTRPDLIDNRKDIIRLVGWNVRPKDGKNVSAFTDIEGYVNNEGGQDIQAYDNELTYSKWITSAEIVGNDGRGTMEVKFNFGTTDSLTVTFIADNVPVLDPRTKTLYPYQGRQAPSDITVDKMPVNF